MNPWSNPSITSWQIYHRKIKRFSFISLPIRHIPPNASCTVFLWFLRTQTINNYVACIFVRWWTVTCKWRQHIWTRRIFTCSFKNLHTHTRMHTYKVVRHAYISQPFDRINESGRETNLQPNKWIKMKTKCIRTRRCFNCFVREIAHLLVYSRAQ